jgi:hypothetical protein
MNKELQEIIDEVYHRYCISQEILMELDIHNELLTQEEFIGRVITNPDFAKQWGVTIYTIVEDENVRIGINYNNKTIESYE